MLRGGGKKLGSGDGTMVDVLVVRRMALRRGRYERGFDLDGKTLERCWNGDRKVVDGWKGRFIWGLSINSNMHNV